MTSFAEAPPQSQKAVRTSPYDSWVSPDGSTIAQFYRRDGGYLVRFPDQADFEIASGTLSTRACAVSEDMRPVAITLYHNAILPMIGNYRGGLNLHGSAIDLDGRAAAFLGASRRGKTTLAGAFAKAGHPYLSEDVVAIEADEDAFLVNPARAVLRLFHDSASFLLGHDPDWTDEDGKQELATGASLPFSRDSVPLASIYLLGPGDATKPQIRRIEPQRALAQLLPHAFILDVEDKGRLRGHFERLGNLSFKLPCYELDYPREFEILPQVIDAIRNHMKESDA
ncbi:hypothetical protein GCM10009127_03240 [Alteraurantiacibacter aestuarii]|uniref:HprK-related kinase A n=1 Tax=Alteraurantiacibacter aestuarii TaxID=650004 RepID=A0A844ZM82_9SPHN|nr:hypothetical protein [Alteraurantiacibacter aestuarii]MXO88422.1 hypothetical protein [Alteraurantiacibacter aestuarii]